MISVYRSISTAIVLPIALFLSAQVFAQIQQDPRVASNERRSGTSGGHQVRGRVLGSDGTPLAKANLYFADSSVSPTEWPLLGVSNDEGRYNFTLDPRTLGSQSADAWHRSSIVARSEELGVDWIKCDDIRDGTDISFRLKQQVPISGRLVDLQGNAISGAKIHVAIGKLGEGGFSQFVKSWKSSPAGAVGVSLSLGLGATTDPEGRFSLKGIGQDRIVSVRFEAPRIAHQTIYVVPRPPADLKPLQEFVATHNVGGEVHQLAKPHLFGAQFEFAVGPAKPIIGRVVEMETGKPIVGAYVSGRPHYDSRSSSPAGFPGEGRAIGIRTGQDGSFRLNGISKSQHYRVSVSTPGWLHASRTIADTAGQVPIEVEIQLERDWRVLVRGRVVNKQTGESVACRYRYVPATDNPHYRKWIELRGPGLPVVATQQDGSFALRVPAGLGFLCFRALKRPNSFHFINSMEKRAAITDQYGYYNAMIPIGPKETEEVVELGDIALTPGGRVTGHLLDPGGRPLSGASMIVFDDILDNWKQHPLTEATFATTENGGSTPRILVFTQAKRHLGKVVIVPGQSKSPLEVVLERPARSLSGRLVGSSGSPVVGCVVRFCPSNKRTSMPPFLVGELLGHFPNYGALAKQDVSYTSASGSFQFEELLTGIDYDIYVRVTGEQFPPDIRGTWLPVKKNVRVQSGPVSRSWNDHRATEAGQLIWRRGRLIVRQRRSCGLGCRTGFPPTWSKIDNDLAGHAGVSIDAMLALTA